MFFDRAIIDGPARLTKEGHLVAFARVAKANNIQDYMPAELGLAPKADGSPYRIFRPEAEVFARDAMQSMAHRPITIDHPINDVDAANWKDLAVGNTGGEVIRDGDCIRVPVMVMDSKGVNAARTTHREFSVGYAADLDMTPGKFGDAEYDGSMRNIRANHHALCPSARGGHELRIVDERTIPETKTMKIKIGDAEVDLSDGAAVAVAIGALNAKMADAETRAATAEGKVAEQAATIVAKDAEIVTLTQKVADSALTPEKLRDAAKSFATTVGKAKALGVAVTDAMDEPAIMKAVVTAKMGDAAAGYSADQVKIAFDVLAKDAKSEVNALDAAIAGVVVNVGDADKAASDARAKMIADMLNPAAAA